MTEPGPSLKQREIGEIFDQVLGEVFAGGRGGQATTFPGQLDPEVAQAVAALRALFEGNPRLTADLSFDQVYAKALPHFTTIWKRIMHEQNTRDT